MINLKAGKVITITGSALSSGAAWWVKVGSQDLLIGNISAVPLVLGPYINDALIDITMSAGTFTYFFNGEGDQIPTSFSNFLGGVSTAISSPINNGGSIGQFNYLKPNIIGFGDSRTFLDHAVGSATIPPYSTIYRFNNGIISKAQSLLGEIYNYKYQYNGGVSGDTAQGLNSRKATTIPRIMAQRPFYEEWDVVYWVDINDALAGITSASFLSNFASTMRYLQDVGIRNVFVMSGIPYPLGYAGESAATHAARIVLIKEYNAGMAAYCAKYEGLHFIDNYETYGGGLDTARAEDGITDIHPGAIGTDRLVQNLVTKIVAVRGKNTLPIGISLNQNPRLIDVETIVDSGTAGNYYCFGRTAGVITTKSATDGALEVTLDATDGVAKTFNFFSNSTTVADTLMPGDIVQLCIEAEHVSAIGLPRPVGGYMVSNSGSPTLQAYANAVPGYTQGVLLGLGRQNFYSDPYTIPAGRAGVVMQPAVTTTAPIGTKLVYKLYGLSTRRVYTSPNAEYSASGLVPFHRKNVRVLSSTAAGSFTLQLSPLAYVDDGYEHVFEDVQGNASVKTLTLRGGTIDYYAPAWAINTAYALGAVVANAGNWYICTQAGTSAGAGGPTTTGTNIVDNTVRWDYRPCDLIMDGGAAAETKVLNTNYFRKIFRANKGLGAWVAIN